MSRIYLSHTACGGVRSYLLSRGHSLELIKDDPRFGRGLESHADLRICKLGAAPSSPIMFSEGVPSPDYPENASFCAVLLDKYIIHRLDITDRGILKYAEEHALTSVHVRQGYAKCSCAVVDGRSVITADGGVYAALSALPDVDVLRVQAGHVRLPCFEYGFIGGACGRVGGELIFNGDLSAHPDCERITDFIRRRGLGVKYFPEYELTDIGSIIESCAP